MTKPSSIDALSGNTKGGFAIVGIGCRLPGGVTNAESYWQFLKDRKCGIKVIPDDRWNVDMFYDSDQNMVGRSVSKWAGIIDNVRDFDPAFFGLSPREASAMDPQQRLVLQTAYEAMEDSGIPSDHFSKLRTGVFVGIQTSDYREVQQQRRGGGNSYGGTSSALCIVANRVSHRFNLRGPSYSVDTACSSSLTALNQAVLNLRLGQCDYAVVSGVNLLLSSNTFIAFSKAGMLSGTGVLSTFDSKANGFVRGEGIGTVILKPVDRALADGDKIYAVIEESAANQDGFTSTITAPNQKAQIDMLETLLERGNATPDMIGYVEAHGTGTPIGDPIEAGAIGRVIGQNKTNGPLTIGSVKPNIGHLESGAGVNGLIKLALAIHNSEIAPNINFEKPNPRIPLDALNLRVPTEVEDFPEVDGVRRGVVNSFGFGGANASALLRSAPERPVEGVYRKPVAPATPAAPRLFPISARTEKSLKDLAAEMARALRKGGMLDKADLGELAAALGVTRTHHPHRAVVVAKDLKELLKGFDYLASDDSEAEDPGNVHTGQVNPGRKLCFMFAGQGSQWWAMARDLLENNKVFQEAVDAYDKEFRKAAGWSIKEELLRDEASSRIDDTTVTQPALFAIQAGLCAVWKSWGVNPDMVTGHSIGEAAAAYVAGGLSLEGAARFLSKRGAIRDQLGAKGAMAAIGLDVEDVTAILPDHGLINIAAINGPGSTTISGDYDAIHEFVEEFQAANPNTLARILRVDTAWHSYQLEAGEDWFRREVAQIDCTVPKIPFISTVTGQPETKFDIDYGWLNLRRPVNFQGGIECALAMGASVFLEMGPHTTLTAPATSTAADKGATVEVINSLNRKQDDFLSMASAAARLFVSGTDLDWKALNGEPTRHFELPRYPWANESLWMDGEEWLNSAFPKVTGALLGYEADGAKAAWMSEVKLQSFPYLRDHRMQSECLFPGTGYMEIIFEAARQIFEDGVIEVEHLHLHETLFIPAEGEVRFWTEYVDERNQIQVYSQMRDTGEDWVLRADAIIRVNNVKPKTITPLRKDSKGCMEFPHDLLYQGTSEDGFVYYGPAFQTVRELWASSSRVGARVVMTPECEHGFEKYLAHPALLDACLQVSDPRVTKENALKATREDLTEAFLPVGALQMRLFRPIPSEFKIFSRHRDRLDPVTAVSDFVITDMDDNVVFEMNGMLYRALPAKAGKDHPEGFAPHYAVESYSEYRLPAPAQDAPAPGRWLVLAGKDAQSERVVRELTARGAEITRLSPDEVSTDEMSEDLADILSEAVDRGPLEGILYLWSLGADAITGKSSADQVSDAVSRETTALIALGAALEEIRYGEDLPRLVVVTRDACPVPDGQTMSIEGLLQAPLPPLLRTIANETPEIDMRQIDADGATLNAADRLVDAILTPNDETEIVLRERGDFVPRLNRVWPEEMPAQELQIAKDDPDSNFYVTMEAPGVIDNMEVVECPMTDVGPDEVRVQVAAVGLNFRDVMAVTGLLPREAEGEPAWRNLGLEFGGTIVATGKNVKGFKRGDRVMGLGKRCLQRFLNVHPSALAKVPDHISLEEASTIPSAFATAHYALNRVGRLAKGEKVLVHVATGGVGTAAVQMAKNVGAEIFATAGSPAKRKLLKEQGIKHVMNSRDLSFADEVMRKTDGRGVDVLLNSLPGPFIDKGMEIVAPYGRFLEIGKRDVYEDNSIGMKALRRNVSLSVLDLAAMGVERPDMLGEMLQELSDSFVRRELEPLPMQTFPVNKVADAFRFMSQAKHIGKVVVTFDQDSFDVKASQDREIAMDPGGAYLVTGGNGGFGLSIAAWMARAGAGKLILASRSGKVSDEEQGRLREIEKAGAKVELVSLDVTSQKDTEAFVAKRFKDKKYPLKGVLHAAAVIKDGFITQLTPEMIDDVIRPKVAGAWSLHKAFEKAGQQPDFMISFSSISSTTGAGGQANYVAANAFLDALAAHRKQVGDMGGSLNWGAIAGTGIVGRNEELRNYLESMGLRGLEEEETPEGIENLLRTGLPKVLYANADWQQMSRTNAKLASIPRISGMLKKRDEKSSEVRERLMRMEGQELVDEIQNFVQLEIGNVLKIDPEQIDASSPMNGLGLDSLSSFELKMRIETAMGLSLQVGRFLKATTVAELVEILAEEAETMKREAGLAAASDGEDEDAGNEASSEGAGMVLSDRGAGLLRESVAPMSTETVRRALEHRIAVEITPAVDEKALKKAVKAVSKRHKLLSCRLSGKAPNSEVVFDGAGIALQQVEQLDAEAINSLDPVDNAVAQVSWSNGSGKKTDLLLQIHMGVADRDGAFLLLEDLLTVMSGGKPQRAISKSKLFDELQRRTYDADDALSQNDSGFWQYAVGNNASPVPFARRARAIMPAGLGRDHGQAVTWTASRRGNDLAEADFVLAFAKALAQATGHEANVLLSRQAPRPERLKSAVAVAPFDAEQPIFVPMDKSEAAQHRFVSAILEHASDHDSLDLYALRGELGEQFVAMNAAPFQIGYAFGTEPDGLESHLRSPGASFGDLRVVARDAGLPGVAHDVFIGVTSSGNKTGFVVRMDRDVVSPDEAERLIHALATELQWEEVTSSIQDNLRAAE